MSLVSFFPVRVGLGGGTDSGHRNTGGLFVCHPLLRRKSYLFPEWGLSSWERVFWAPLCLAIIGLALQGAVYQGLMAKSV